jgi:hypothetical protein
VHVAAIRLQIDDRIADDLSWTVVGDVAAAAGLVHGDAARRERIGRRQDVGAAPVAADAKREHVRMLDEQQLIVDLILAPLVDKRSLQLERLGVRDLPEPADD